MTGLRWATLEADRGEIAAALRDALAGVSLAAENIALLQAAVGEGEIGAVRREIAEACSGQPPPCHLVRQAHGGDRGVAALLWLYEGVVVRNGSVASIGQGSGKLHFVDGVSAPAGTVGEQWEHCFRSLDAALQGAGLATSSLVKLWTYYGNSGEDDHFPQFSDHRNRLFSGVQFSILAGSGDVGLPASTGVYASVGESALGAIAASGAEARAVVNPLQVDPHCYQPPMRPAWFSRGVRAELDGEGVLLASGTASIVGSAVVHEGHADAQARQVLTLLGALQQEAKGGGEARGGYMVVYVRDRKEATTVRGILDDCHPGVPTLVIVAPLSRPNLLVEVDSAAIVTA